MEGGNPTGVRQSSMLGFYGERVCRRRNQPCSLREAQQAQLLSYQCNLDLHLRDTHTYDFTCSDHWLSKTRISDRTGLALSLPWLLRAWSWRRGAAQLNSPDHCVEGPIYKFHEAEIGGVTSAFIANLVYCGERWSGKVLAQDGVVGDESERRIECRGMAWNDCMCAIDKNAWIKFEGVSGLKLHQVMAWKHRCLWQKIGALFSELWEPDCCSGEELPDWRHEASSVFWCDG